MPLKLTSWNIKNANSLASSNLNPTNSDRRARIQDTIDEIDPDVLCLIEGPKGESRITAFANHVLKGRWEPILLPNDGRSAQDQDRMYQTSGTQWIWFLAKPSLAAQCRIQDPTVWRSYVGSKSWKVHYWGKVRASRYDHYRHPQVLILDLGSGVELEIVGLHLKSKINKNKITKDQDKNLTGPYLDEALKARIKLASQARDVRAYLNKRFDQGTDAAILLMGDINDGPGQDYFERLYLFFDLISNLQGSVMDSDRFLNHALFDFQSNLRWTARYDDELLDIPADRNPLLLDHILMTQALVNGSHSLQAQPHSGSVEHKAFDRGNAGASSSRKTSDHRPVSILLSGSP